MNKLMGLSALVCAALVVTACSSAVDDDSSSGLTPITVSAIPIPDTAPLHVGLAKGFFADEGLDVTIQQSTGGSAAVPGVVSGDYDFAYSGYVPGMLAVDKGLDLQFVANGNSSGGSPDFQAVIVKKDSPIQSLSDLSGMRVAINNLSNINDTIIRTLVDGDGGDSAQLKFVEVPFSDAEAAVANGEVDAATVNPFFAEMEKDYRVITYNFHDFDPNLAVGGYLTTGKTIKDRPDVVKAFAAAMNKSLEYANENPQEVRDAIASYTKLSGDKLKDMALPTFSPDIDHGPLKKLGDAAVKYGTLTKAPDLDKLLP